MIGYEQFIEEINRSPFNKTEIVVVDNWNESERFAEFTAKVTISDKNSTTTRKFKKKYFKLNKNDFTSDFIIIMKDKFLKDFIHNYFLSGLIHVE